MISNKIINISESFLHNIDPDDQQEVRTHLQSVLERLSLGLFRIVIVGEIKKGKSSFIGALLGEHDLLPMDSDVATSTVYKIIYGPQKKYTVFF